MQLDTYISKRDFRKTPEPRPEKHPRVGGNSFCVQKHDATRLHYDFRLELDGVLKSWAVTKGPSLDPKDRRLAVRTEDHPLAYGSFEGSIPQGEYGGGTVMLWDEGTWEPIGDPHEGLEKGHLKFNLHGTRLKGRWALVLMRNKDERDKKENWLLIKDGDEEADPEHAPVFLEENATSVKTGATMEEIAARSDIWHSNRAPAKARPHPKKVGPPNADLTEARKLAADYKQVQLATLVSEPPAGKDWVHEIKFDGYRILCFVADGGVVIKTRNGNDWTQKFPAVAAALAELNVKNAVIDGEAVMLDDKGRSSFQALQQALGDGGDLYGIQGYFFDLLHLNGKDLTSKPLIERKKALQKLFKSVPISAPINYSEHLEGAEDVLKHACEMGLEGVVSKRAGAPYFRGRSKGWLKSKCSKRQEFVIIGFTRAKNDHRAIGALHIAYMSEGELVYAGKVGTGFSHGLAEKIYKQLEPLELQEPKIKKGLSGPAMKGAVWVKPQMLCEVSFTEWTESGHVRHPSFEGLREDKPVTEVVREKPIRTSAVLPGYRHHAVDAEVVVRDVKITHPERVVFEKELITKGELAEYYGQIAPYMLKDISGHPISLVRCPSGADAECFFQRNPDKYMRTMVKSFPWTHKGNKHEYLYVEDVKGIVFLVQMGVIEIHPWGAKASRIDYPTRMIFDLDPAEGIDFEAVKLAAHDVRGRLKKRGLKTFVKCTGGKGLHVVAPLQGKKNWAEVKTFAASIAAQMVEAAPEAYVATMSKAKRDGKIFIDYFRNDYTATAIADYSVRARPGAPVAVPLHWEELGDLKSANAFSLKDVIKRLEKLEPVRAT